MSQHSDNQTSRPILTRNRFLGLLLISLLISSYRTPTQKPRRKLIAWAWILLLVSLLGLLGIVILHLTIHLQNASLKQQLPSPAATHSTVNRTTSPQPTWAKQFDHLRQQNPDFQALLTIPGTKINHPVMHTPSDSEDEDFYLRRNFSKNYDLKGTLFFDKHNNLTTRDQNLIIYGHNMDDGSMFGELEKYKRPDFYQQHQFFYLYKTVQSHGKTIYHTEKYQIFAVFRSKVYYNTDRVFKYYQFYNAKSSDDLKYAISSIKSMALYPTEAIKNITLSDHFLTLSTCEYSQDHGRLVVMGKLVN